MANRHINNKNEQKKVKLNRNILDASSSGKTLFSIQYQIKFHAVQGYGTEIYSETITPIF